MVIDIGRCFREQDKQTDVAGSKTAENKENESEVYVTSVSDLAVSNVESSKLDQ